MKKKIISVLTALMVLSMSTTVFGATSPTTGTIEPVDTSKVTIAADATTAVKAENVSGATFAVATETETTLAAKQAETLGYKANVVAVFNLTAAGAADENGNYNITVAVPSLAAGTEVTIIHMHANGEVDYITSTVAADGKISFSVTSFSTFAIVEKAAVASGTGYADGSYDIYLNNAATDAATSPKTGVPVVLPMMAVICLAGAGVCTKKVKFN